MKTKLIVAILAASCSFNLAACQNDRNKEPTINKMAQNTDRQSAMLAMNSVGTLASNNVDSGINSNAPGAGATSPVVATNPAVNDYNSPGAASGMGNSMTPPEQQHTVNSSMATTTVNDGVVANTSENNTSNASGLVNGQLVPVGDSGANDAAMQDTTRGNGSAAVNNQVTEANFGQGGANAGSNNAAANTSSGTTNYNSAIDITKKVG